MRLILSFGAPGLPVQRWLTEIWKHILSQFAFSDFKITRMDFVESNNCETSDLVLGYKSSRFVNIIHNLSTWHSISISSSSSLGPTLTLRSKRAKIRAKLIYSIRSQSLVLRCTRSCLREHSPEISSFTNGMKLKLPPQILYDKWWWLMTLSFLSSKKPIFTLQTAKSLVLGSPKTENILHQLLLSRGDTGEKFKWKLLDPRYLCFRSIA